MGKAFVIIMVGTEDKKSFEIPRPIDTFSFFFRERSTSGCGTIIRIEAERATRRE